MEQQQTTEFGRDYKSYCEARYLIETITEPSEDDGCALANLMLGTDGLTCLYIWDFLMKYPRMLLAVHPFISAHMVKLAVTPSPVREAMGKYRGPIYADGHRHATYHKIWSENDAQYKHFLSIKRFLTSDKVLSTIEAEEGEG